MCGLQQCAVLSCFIYNKRKEKGFSVGSGVNTNLEDILAGALTMIHPWPFCFSDKMNGFWVLYRHNKKKVQESTKQKYLSHL